MTPALPNLGLDTKDRPQSGDINKQPASDPSLHTFGIDHFELISEASKQHDDSSLALVIFDEVPSSEMQPATVETQTLPAGATEPARSTPPHIADAKDSKSWPSASTPKSTVQATQDTDLGTGVEESTPEVESEADQKVKLQHLRFQLQRGLLPEKGCPKPEEMKAMSLCMRQLEGIEKPWPSALKDNSIRKLLKAINKLKEIPRDSEFEIKDRAAGLLQKWKASFEKGDPTTFSPRQPTDDYDLGPNAITGNQNSVDAPSSQQQLKEKTKRSTIGLTENILSTTVVESEPSTGDHIIEHVVAPPTNHSMLSPPTSPTTQNRPERLVIDLTSDDEVDTDTRSKSSHQPMNLPGKRLSVVQERQISQLPPGQKFEISSTAVRKGQSGSKTGSVNSGAKKRKRSDGTGNERTLASASNSRTEARPACDTPSTPKRIRRKQKKTAPGAHLNTEIGWINQSLKWTNEKIEEVDTEFFTIREKRNRLLEEIEAEMQSLKTKKNDLIKHREYLLNWGAQDQKVTDEWSPSK